MRKFFLSIVCLFLASTAEAAYLDLAWSPNGEPDIGGYKVYYGTSSGDYINSVDVGNVTDFRLDDLIEDVTYYMALTAYDRAGNESAYSQEVAGVGVVEPVDDGGSPPSGGESGGSGGGSSGGCFVSASLKNP